MKQEANPIEELAKKIFDSNLFINKTYIDNKIEQAIYASFTNMPSDMYTIRIAYNHLDLYEINLFDLRGGIEYSGTTVDPILTITNLYKKYTRLDKDNINIRCLYNSLVYDGFTVDIVDKTILIDIDQYYRFRIEADEKAFSLVITNTDGYKSDIYRFEDGFSICNFCKFIRNSGIEYSIENSNTLNLFIDLYRKYGSKVNLSFEDKTITISTNHLNYVTIRNFDTIYSCILRYMGPKNEDNKCTYAFDNLQDVYKFVEESMDKLNKGKINSNKGIGGKKNVYSR